MENKFPIRFYLIAFILSWLIMVPFSLLAKFEIIQTDIYGFSKIPLVIAAFGPALAAYISLRTIEGKEAAKKYFKSFLSLKFGWKVWFFIIFYFGILSFTAWFIPELFGEERIPISTYMPNIYIFPIYFLMMVLFGGGQEELGWRYILPHLERKFGLIIGALIHGMIWAIWHLPLWLVPGTNQIYMNFLVFMLLTIGFSYFFSWICEKSGNRLLSGLFVHGSINAYVALFPIIIMDHDAKQTRFLLYAVLSFILGIIIVIIRTVKKQKTST